MGQGYLIDSNVIIDTLLYDYHKKAAILQNNFLIAIF